MPEGQETTSGSLKSDSKPKHGGGIGRRFLWASAAVVGVLILAGYLVGWDRHGWRRHHREISPEEFVEHLDKRAAWLLDSVDASAEQHKQVSAILREVAPEVVKLQGTRKALRAQFMSALDDGQLSAEERAELRASSVRLAEQATDRALETMFKALDILTPEQRIELLKKWEERR